MTDGASVLSRRKVCPPNSHTLTPSHPHTLTHPQCDCIDMSDLKLWVELLPTDYVTFLIDCHHSHVVSYGKQRLVSGPLWSLPNRPLHLTYCYIITRKRYFVYSSKQFGLIWSILVWFDRFWYSGMVWSYLVHFGSLVFLVQFGLIWSILVWFGRFWYS